MSKYGKKSIYIDSNNFVADLDENNYTSDSTYYQISDAIRYYSKNFWILNNNKNVLASEIDNNNALFKIYHEEDSSIKLVANKDKFINRIINDKGILEDKFDDKKWEQFLKDITPPNNNIFRDFYLEFQEPINFTQIDCQEINTNYINREFKYNFYSQKYENLSNDRTLDVTTLPNLFSLLNDKNLDTRTYEENLVLSLGGLIDTNYVDSLYIATDYNDNVKKYFDEYSDKYNTIEARTVINTLANENYNTNINKNKVNLCRKINFIPFPYYIDLTLANDASNKDDLIHFITKTGKLSDDLIKHLKETVENITQTNFINIVDVPEQKKIDEFDFKFWIDRELTGELNTGTADSTRIYNENSRIYSQIEYTNLMQYIKNNIKPKIRKYSEFTNKSSNYHILYYKIQKKQFNNNTQPIQTFWVTPDDGEFIRFIDTQVKYGIEYFYSVTAYVMVAGNEYTYDQYNYESNLDKIRDITNGQYKLKVNNKSSYKILQLKVADISGAVHEFPNTKPIVKLEKDGNKVRINLLESPISTFEKFELIENKDFNLFESIRKSQENTEIDKIESRINKYDTVGLQIYKSLVKPISYLSFQGKLFKTITIGNEKSFIDDILPNTKYWYLFRYLNNHNTPSNVSNIYEVQMKNEDGYSYLDVNILDMNKGAEKTFFKNMKRYLLIRPSVIQTQTKLPEIVSSIDDINLGPSANSVWNKNFVIRLTSKKTNRVLEFNLKSIINRKKE